MPTLRLQLTLLTDVAIPAVSRTIDNPGTRRFIPGRLLLGAAAARLHATLSPEDAWRIFQTDAVRFLDALPQVDGTRTIPPPRSLHTLKGDPDTRLHNLVTEAARAATENRQVQAWTADFVTPGLDRAVTVPTETSLRTAIGFDRRAANGLLYTLDVIRAGAVLETRIVAERAADLDLLERALVGAIQLGRSRSAELGRVRVTSLGRDEAAPTQPVRLDRVAWLAVSGLAFHEAATGSPTFSPSPADFGLDAGWELDPERTFVRTERFAPFHGTRRLPDTERLLVAPGSVLAFRRTDKTQSPVSPVAAVGAWRNEGFGEVLRLDGPLVTPHLPRPTPVSPAKASAPPPAGDELFAWATREAAAYRHALDLAEAAREKARDMAAWRVSTSQWGALRAKGRAARLTHRPVNEFLQDVRKQLETGIGKLERAWGEKLRTGETAAQALLATLEGRSDAAAFTEVLAEHVVRQKKSNRRNRGDRA
jgi:CRISPR-associated protein Csx10